MKKIILGICISVSITSIAQVSIDGTRVVEITPAATTGLSKIYVLENAGTASLNYRATGSNVHIQRYSNLGGGYAEDVTGIEKGGSIYKWTSSANDLGYIINDNGKQTCFWVTNYANHNYSISELSVDASDCDRVTLRCNAVADEIAYYTINGRRDVIDRDIQLSYYTLTFSEENLTYNQISAMKSYSHIGHTFNAPAPLCDTEFSLSPDRFQRAWGIGHDVTSPSFIATAIEAQTTAVQNQRENSNEQKIEIEGLGGSAPCEISFAAAVTDAAIYKKWEISSSADFEDIIYSYDSLDFDFVFNEAGTTYVRFTANNAAGTCEYLGETYSVVIGESRLECPNAFSPGASEGVNDEWRVSYRSIIQFDCQIFNRAGQRLATLSDPSQGWDGKVRGKVVPSGVYFYVIKAKGSDGKIYNLSGDINIINSRRNTQPGAVTE